MGVDVRAICERSAALGGRTTWTLSLAAITAPTNPRPEFGNGRPPLAASTETAEVAVHVERGGEAARGAPCGGARRSFPFILMERF